MVRNFSDKERIEEMCVQCSSGRCEFPIVGVFFPDRLSLAIEILKKNTIKYEWRKVLENYCYIVR